MKFQPGNKEQAKRKRAGDLPDSVKIIRKVEEIKEKITQDALIELANNKVFGALRDTKEFNRIRDMGLPITLKAISEKVNVTFSDKDLKDMQYEQPNKALEQLARRKKAINTGV